MKLFTLAVAFAFTSTLHAEASLFTSINGVVTTSPILPYADSRNAINNQGQVLTTGFADGVVCISSGTGCQYVTGGNGGGDIYVRAEGTALNDTGQAVGRYSPDLNSWFYANGSVTAVSVPGSNETDLFGLSSTGVSIGNYSDGTGYYPFTFSNGTYTFTDKSLGQVRGINASGVIIGGLLDSFGFVDDHGMLTYLIPPGASNSYAVAIADTGLIAGWYLDNIRQAHTFFYQDGIYTFTDFGLGRPGLDDSVFITSMSSDGMNLIGAVNQVSTTTPEPASFRLALCSVVLLLGRLAKALLGKEGAKATV